MRVWLYRLRLMLMMAALLCGCLMLYACESYEPESTAEDATSYYQEKYGSSATVTDSHGLGNYSLFGYSYHGMEYIMSDGVSVVYNDYEGEFRDNRQGDEIQQAVDDFARAELEKIPGALTSLELVEVDGEVGAETYEGTGPCWHTRYDGDVKAFLLQEWPSLYLGYHFSGQTMQKGRFGYGMAYDQQQVDSVEEAYIELGRYFNLSSITLAIVDPVAFEQAGEGDAGLSLLDEGLVCTIEFFGDSPGEFRAVRYKPAFIDVLEGLQLSSAQRDIALEDGDITFTSRGHGFYRCAFSDALLQSGATLECYIQNDTAQGITQLLGVDSFWPICRLGETQAWAKFENGALYYFGDPDDIRPYVEVESITADKVVFRYHTFFKKAITHAELKVIGMAYREGTNTAESSAFESRIVEETEDGWLCEVEVREDAVPSNTLYLQFTYDNADDVSVQIEQPVEFPLVGR